jgi:hypothetical protein
MRKEKLMKARTIALALAAGTTLLTAAPAFAQPPHHAPAYGWRAKHYHPHYYRAPAYVYYPARPVVVVPAPYYYPPRPVVYYPPRPVVVPAAPVLYGNIPVSPNVNIGFGVRF